MMHIHRFMQVAIVALLGVPAACSSPNPALYVIAPTPGPTVTGAPKAIELRQIGLARYLERNEIVRSSERYRLDVMPNDWWGEPLGAMLGRVLATDLGQRLPGSTVYPEFGAVTPPPDATVSVDVSRLDEDAKGILVLQAEAATAITGQRKPLTRAFRFEIVPPVPGTAGQVSAASTAVGQLADGIALMLVESQGIR